MAKLTNQADRVTYSLGVAIKDYGTGFDVHVSYGTDVREDESPKAALARAAKFVEKEVEKKAGALKKQG